MAKYLINYYSCKKLPIYISLGVIHLSFLKKKWTKYSFVKLAYDKVLYSLNNPRMFVNLVQAKKLTVDFQLNNNLR